MQIRIGVATPGHVQQLIGAFDAARRTAAQLAVRFHDTYGQALANPMAALQAGVTTVDSSAGGLGGCPYAKSATGNLATEDLVWQVHGLGIRTGVDPDALVRASAWMAGELGRPSPSRVARSDHRRGLLMTELIDPAASISDIEDGATPAVGGFGSVASPPCC